MVTPVKTVPAVLQIGSRLRATPMLATPSMEQSSSANDALAKYCLICLEKLHRQAQFTFTLNHLCKTFFSRRVNILSTLSMPQKCSLHPPSNAQCQWQQKVVRKTGEREDHAAPVCASGKWKVQTAAKGKSEPKATQKHRSEGDFISVQTFCVPEKYEFGQYMAIPFIGKSIHRQKNQALRKDVEHVLDRKYIQWRKLHKDHQWDASLNFFSFCHRCRAKRYHRINRSSIVAKTYLAFYECAFLKSEQASARAISRAIGCTFREPRGNSRF